MYECIMLNLAGEMLVPGFESRPRECSGLDSVRELLRLCLFRHPTCGVNRFQMMCVFRGKCAVLWTNRL